MAKTLLLHPTPIAEWQALVEEAINRNSCSITEEIESYLVFLLMRFSGSPEVARSILATDFLQSFQQLRKERLNLLRDVGDKCLLFAGLFPGHAQKRRVRISYFVRLGQLSYTSLSEVSETRHSALAELYADLAEHFVLLMDIMHCMREANENTTALDLLQAEELWSDTRSRHALNTLRKTTQGFISSNLFPSNHTHTHHSSANNSSNLSNSSNPLTKH